jgi:uncharacterized protein with NRDE domain
MCLAAFAIHAAARWPLVVASNRDEFYDRPALPMAFWQTASGQSIMSGRDLRADGTWLGTTPGGRIALLTNVRDVREASAPAAPRTRGELVMDWLVGAVDADRFMAQTDCMLYGGFNMVLGDLQSGNWAWVSNRVFDMTGSVADRPQTSGWVSKPLKPGIYGVSNAALDTPWPKTIALKNALKEALESADEASLEAHLWTALASRQQAPDGDLPDTGLPLPLEKTLSSAFIDEPARGQSGYGTRCSTLLVASVHDHRTPDSWTIRIKEKTHGAGRGATSPPLHEAVSLAFQFQR